MISHKPCWRNNNQLNYEYTTMGTIGEMWREDGHNGYYKDNNEYNNKHRLWL